MVYNTVYKITLETQTETLSHKVCMDVIGHHIKIKWILK